jgi:hypothetical protein
VWSFLAIPHAFKDKISKHVSAFELSLELNIERENEVADSDFGSGFLWFSLGLWQKTNKDIFGRSCHRKHASASLSKPKLLRAMLQKVKHLLHFAMSDEPEPPINDSLFPQMLEDDFKVAHRCNGVLGRHLAFASLCYLDRLDHCKAKKLPKHEFLMVYLTFYMDEKKHETCMIIDRCPAIGPDFEDKPATPKNNSTTSLLSSPAALSPRSASLSPSSQSNHSKAIHRKGTGKVPARDHIMIPKLGRRADLNSLAQTTFGDFDTLNTLSIGEGHTLMSAPQLAMALEIVHNLAPFYTIKKYQCYWFALLVF